MTIERLNQQQTNQGSKPPISVQFEIQKEVFRQSMGVSPNSLQNQLMQLIVNLPTLQQAQQVAQAQISKGFLDIKI
ncbi:MAG: hypothetical protein ACUVQ1_07985 [Candidatus Kapaibacteriales bacterium]